ncbi:proton-conducting transporter membrane subunit [Sulfobacillus thermosulfidooxidans]|uniref:proton-conducting transporter transmembrane domain-containing protein n=1 Tax=Sulfobacillus thermosulfidooxidans TaxID=28034 RepID=UPI0002E0791E|nr:proton-conducting transporter membrane subunit [Sulfobacillus thermosulfidooxidans]
MAGMGRIISDIIVLLPWPYGIVGLAGVIGASRPDRVKKLARGASILSLVSAVAATATYSVAILFLHDGRLLVSQPRGIASITDINWLTLIMMVLVSFVGLVVTRYTDTYMKGDAHEGRFHQWLSLTVGSFLGMIASANMWIFFVFWVATSLSFHQLLAFYPERAQALLTARKKFLVDRMADISLFAALGLIAHTLHSSQFPRVAHELAHIHGDLPLTLQMASGFLVLSALLKSAQIPFHGWLIQVMESPTPVSAVLHAGIIYTGALVLLRMVPLWSREMWTGDVLILTGLLSIVVGSLMMMAATTIKRSLAYSTNAQMGFVLVECGLGLYSLAVLHIGSHAVYKAHAFLSSGGVVEHFRVPKVSLGARGATLPRALGSLVLATAIVMATGGVLGIPGLPVPFIIMGAILTVALTQWLLLVVQDKSLRISTFLGLVVGFSIIVSLAYWGLDELATAVLGGMWPHALSESVGPVREALWGLIIVAFMGLLVLQQNMSRLLRYRWGWALYMFLYNDYIDMVLTQWVHRLWGRYRHNVSHVPQTKKRMEEMS